MYPVQQFFLSVTSFNYSQWFFSSGSRILLTKPAFFSAFLSSPQSCFPHPQPLPHLPDSLIRWAECSKIISNEASQHTSIFSENHASLCSHPLTAPFRYLAQIMASKRAQGGSHSSSHPFPAPFASLPLSMQPWQQPAHIRHTSIKKAWPRIVLVLGITQIVWIIPSLPWPFRVSAAAGF